MVLTVVSCWAVYSFAHDVDRMARDCDGGSCASNDVRGLTLPLAIMSGLAAGAAGVSTLGLTAPGAALAAVGAGLRGGTRAAVADGFTPAQTVGFPTTAAVVLLVAGALVTVAGLAVRLRGLATRRRATGGSGPNR